MNEKPDMQRYRIGDYAHYMGVTPDLLKHYEQIGLITPSVSESGYRFYPFNQSSRLLSCMTLRSYGVPLKEMRDMFMVSLAQTHEGEQLVHHGYVLAGVKPVNSFR